MKYSDEVKKIAEQMLALSAKLLQLVDADETERRRFIEDVKKMRKEKYCNSLAL